VKYHNLAASTVQKFIFIALATVICVLPRITFGKEKITYLILAETVEPIMIVRDGDPMAGGLMTEIVKLIFADSDYEIEPVVLPWQRMKAEFGRTNDWILNGFPESFDPEDAYEMSRLPIFPFNHVAVTMKDDKIQIKSYEDLRNHVLVLVENFQYPGLDEFIESTANGETGGSVGVIEAFTPAGTLQMLRHKRGDIVIDWQARLLYNMEAAGLKYEDVDFHDATNIVPTKNLHIVYSANHSADFKKFLNSRLAAISRSGQLREIVQGYYGSEIVPEF
jgi:polar amino acid transport system substrate-binding protein